MVLHWILIRVRVANYTPINTGGFMRKLDASGNFEYLHKVDAAGSQYSLGVYTDANDQTYLTGNFVGTADFDPGPGVSNLITNNYFKAFVLKLNECSNSTIISQTACDSLVLNGQTYTQSGTHTQTLQNVNGCDSTVTLQLTILQSFTFQYKYNGMR